MIFRYKNTYNNNNNAYDTPSWYILSGIANYQVDVIKKKIRMTGLMYNDQSFLTFSRKAREECRSIRNTEKRKEKVPSSNYLLKVTIETLEKGVKYV